MVPGKNKRSFALFCLVITIIEEAVLVTVLLWLLPHFGINVPAWLFTMLVLAWAAWSYLTYRLGKSAIDKPPAVGPEAMVSTICQTATPLCPKGYVQSGTEIWQACSIFGDIDAGVEVVIIGIKGLTLFVTLSSDTGINKTPNRLSEGAECHDGLPYNRS
jgi:membrane-bound ClpP family serine protease